jgi:hypothetical protein
MGRCGAIVNLDPISDLRGKTERLKRVSVIPMTELQAHEHLWERGETVLVHVDDMEAPLRRRYYNTGSRWSLNVPVFAGLSWVGLIGAAADESGFSEEAVASYECAADGLETVRLADDWLPGRQGPVVRN